MLLSQIKCKITTKKALKPDAFRDYIKYLFENFPEHQANILANSLIVELGRKYNKINNGFTCTAYETATCMWTSGLNDNKNITVDHFDGIFLYEEEQIKRIFSDNTSINRLLFKLYENKGQYRMLW